MLLFKLHVDNSRSKTVLCLNNLLRDIIKVKKTEKRKSCQSQTKTT